MNVTKSKRVVRIGIGIMMVAAGMAHFINADFFNALVPESAAAYRGIINIAGGVIQTAMGVAFLVPRLRAIARWSGVALLGLTLPVAVRQVFHPEMVASLGMTPAHGATLAAVRALVQLFMIGLIWWSTSPDHPSRVNA